MAMVVQHNITAMNASRMLGVTTGQQAKTSEKLASGYRINRAADDAAGLSISEKMRSQIRGLDRASTNAQDGVSAVQTAEGALTEVHSMLQRMNELAVQSANGTNSSVDRAAIQAEIDQLTTEIDRVAQSTKFNETYLLNGDAAAGSKTVYSYIDVTTPASLTDVGDTAFTGTLYAAGGTTALSADDAIAELEAGRKLYTDASATVNQNAADAAAAGTDYTVTLGAAGSSASFGTPTLVQADLVAGAVYTYDAANTQWTDASSNVVNLATVGITLDGTYTPADSDTITVSATAVTPTGGDLYLEGSTTAATAAELLTAVNAGDAIYKVAATGNTQTEAVVGTDYEYTASSTGLAALYDDEGNALTASELTEYLADGNTAQDADGNAVTDLTAYTEAKTLNADLKLSLHVGADSDDTNKIEISIAQMSALGLGVNALKVDTADDATAAIDTIKAAIQQVSDQRSALGAIQNRLEHTIANLDNVVENTTSAESRIRDTDMAEEMVEYSKNNILAQAGQSMLAQANTSTQGVLSLLQ